MSSESDLNCFICFNKFTKVIPPTEAESKSKQCGEIKQIKESDSKLTLKKTIRKIFQYLLIQDKDFNKVYSSLKSEPSFCPDCSISVQEIVEIGKKVTGLELLIQNKVETLGKVIAATASKQINLKKGKIRTEEDKLLWEKFRNPVLQNYMNGILPTPSIVLSKCKSPPASMKDVSKIEELPFNSDSSESYISENENYEPKSIKPKSKRIKKSSQPQTPQPPMLNQKRKRKHSSCAEEEKEKTDLSNEEKDYLECPICSFKTTIEVIKFGKFNKRAPKSAISNMISHFTAHHNPVEQEDISERAEDWKEFYKCTLCEFCSIIQLQTNRHRRLAYQALSRHYLTSHDKFKEVICNHSKVDITVKPTEKFIAEKSKLSKKVSKELEANPAKKAKSSKEEDKLSNSKEEISYLVEGEDYFTCPNKDCSFISTFRNIRNRKDHTKKTQKQALCVIAKHQINDHAGEYDFSKTFNWNKNCYPCLIQTKEGRIGFKCPNQTPSCDFIQLLEDKIHAKGVKNKFRAFLRHYQTHFEVQRRDPILLRYLNCAEKKCGFEAKISKDGSYPLKYPSERGKTLKEKMIQHYQEKHPDKPFPVFEIYESKKIKAVSEMDEGMKDRVANVNMDILKSIKLESEQGFEDEDAEMEEREIFQDFECGGT